MSRCSASAWSTTLSAAMAPASSSTKKPPTMREHDRETARLLGLAGRELP